MKNFFKRLTTVVLTLQFLLAMCYPYVNTDNTALAAGGENMIGKQSQNEGMTGVPAPGEVVIDGNLDEWDWSGRIRMFANLDLAETYSNETAVMYDENYYYIGFKVKDPSPMESTVDPIREGTWIYQKDSVQLRFVTNEVYWISFAYHHLQNRASLLLDQWLTPDNQGGAVHSMIYTTDPYGTELKNYAVLQNNPRVVEGMEIAYLKDPYGTSYNIELKLPWNAIYETKPTQPAGMGLQMGIEMYWGDNTNSQHHEYSYKDNMQPGHTTREFFWTAVNDWGNVFLSPTGNVAVRNYSAEKEVVMSGYFNIDVKVPKDAKYITAMAKDSNGKIVRHIVQEYDVQANLKKGTEDVVTLLWDGRDDYGGRVSPGKYSIECLTHGGLKPIFETTFYGPGNIPWLITDGTGGWGADHTAPISTTSNSTYTYIGWPHAEGGDALIALDKDGRKVWGENRGANIMAATDKYVYALPDGGFYFNGSTGDSYLMRLDAMTGEFRPYVVDGVEQKVEYELSDVLGINNAYVPSVTGMAAYQDYLAIATADNNEKVSGAKYMNFGSYITILNGETSEIIKRIPVAEAGRLAFDDKTGQLYMTDSESLYEVNIFSGKVTPIGIAKSDGFKIGKGLDVDPEGNVVIMDVGTDCQLKAFDPKTGRLVYTAAQKGGRPYEGAWEKEGLTEKVSDISVNALGEICVVENWEYPRRTSIWGRDGKLVRDYIGSVAYSAAGAFLHDQTPYKAYVGPVEMKLDVEKQTYEVTRILYVPDAAKGEEFPLLTQSFENIQHFYSEASGKRKEYIYDGSTFYMEKDDGTFQPVARLGIIKYENGAPDPTMVINTDQAKAYSELHPKLAAAWGDSQYIWNDFNENGVMEDFECEFIDIMPVQGNEYAGDTRWVFNPGSGWGREVLTSDMSWATSSTGSITITRPAYFMESGAPVFTLEDSFTTYKIVLSNGAINRVDGTNEMIQFAAEINVEDVKKNNISSYSITDMGIKENWFYPNDYPGVHGSRNATIKSGNGYIIGPIKNLGFAKAGENRDIDVFALRGNLGSDYFMTTDGFFVQTMFVDSRLPRENLPQVYEDAIGMDMSKMTENTEPFSGWMGTQEDGITRMVVSTASRAAIVAKIEGLETLKYLDPITLVVDKAEMEKAWSYVDPATLDDEEEKGETEEDKVYEIRNAAITVDGSINDWSGTEALRIDSDGESGSIRLAHDDTKLYGYFDISNDSSPMVNSGAEFQKLFKTGDVVEIHLSPSANATSTPLEGDMRLKFSVMNGEPIAVMMKAVDSGSLSADFFNYTSPVGSRDFDTVKILENAEVVIQRSANGYTVEVSVPLADIEMMISDGMMIRGDVGFIASDPDGRINIARKYYFNKETGLTSDLPGEAELTPGKWGDMKIVG